MTAAFPKPTRPPRERHGLRRRTRLVAKRWMVRRSPKRLDNAQSNPAFLAWLHGENCCMAGPRCSGRIEAHHAGRKQGVGMKASDDTCVPLCSRHHRELTEHRGAFAGMSREQLRATQDEWIAATFGRWLSHGTRRSG